jgi:hypothetical protein
MPSVPDVVGLNQSDAEARLQGANLRLGTVTQAPSPTAAPGIVVSTTPAAGSRVDSGSAVNLEVSSGPTKVAVPDVVGLNQSDAEARLQGANLRLGTVTQAPSPTAAPGIVVSTTPAAGSRVDSGSAVNLEVSSGPTKVAVPDVAGLTRQAAETTLKTAGLAVGSVKKRHNNLLPAGGIIATDPKAGAPISQGSAVELEVSKGPERNWTQYIPHILFGALGLIILTVILCVILDSRQVFLNNLAAVEVARGLITFLIAIATVGIALILTVSTLVLGDGDDGDKRFDRAKQVLTVLIGVLGTIVGFYFGQANASTRQAKSSAVIITTALPEGATNKPYQSTTIQTAGLTPPLNWSVMPPLPAGLNLDQATGAISGTPTTTLPKTPFRFTVTDSATPANVLTADLSVAIK